MLFSKFSGGWVGIPSSIFLFIEFPIKMADFVFISGSIQPTPFFYYPGVNWFGVMMIRNSAIPSDNAQKIDVTVVPNEMSLTSSWFPPDVENCVRGEKRERLWWVISSWPWPGKPFNSQLNPDFILFFSIADVEQLRFGSGFHPEWFEYQPNVTWKSRTGWRIAGFVNHGRINRPTDSRGQQQQQQQSHDFLPRFARHLTTLRRGCGRLVWYSTTRKAHPKSSHLVFAQHPASSGCPAPSKSRTRRKKSNHF